MWSFRASVKDKQPKTAVIMLNWVQTSTSSSELALFLLETLDLVVCQRQIDDSQVSTILLIPVHLTSATGSNKKRPVLVQFLLPVWDRCSNNSDQQIFCICKVKTSGCRQLGFQLNYWCSSRSQRSAPMETSVMESDTSTSQLRDLLSVSFCLRLQQRKDTKLERGWKGKFSKMQNCGRTGTVCVFPACVQN